MRQVEIVKKEDVSVVFDPYRDVFCLSTMSAYDTKFDMVLIDFAKMQCRLLVDAHDDSLGKSLSFETQKLTGDNCRWVLKVKAVDLDEGHGQVIGALISKALSDLKDFMFASGSLCRSQG